jgi:ABC-2 type transport system ATP-binding protein
MPIIETKKLSKTYEYFKKEPGLLASVKGLFKREKLFSKAVHEISLSIEEGELVGFLGPNGAGKTTTLKMLSGILHPTEGSASVLGFTPWKRQKEYQKQFALVMGQKNQLWWDLPAMDSFLLNKEIYEIPENEFDNTLKELSDLLDVHEILEIQVRKLSLGQRMKCELISSLLHRPKVLFLDEPTIGLDVVAQKNIRDFIKRYNKESNTTIILTSHYMEDIKELCKRVIIIDMGKIIYDGLLSDLISKYAPEKYLTVTFEAEVTKEEVCKFGQINKFNPIKVVFNIKRDEVKDAAKEILSSNLPVDDIFIDEVDIDDIIRKIFINNRNDK